MPLYNWQRDEWPKFTYNLDGLEDSLISFAEKTGLLAGTWDALPEDSRQEAVVNLMTAEAIKTSRIEGEFLSREDVHSSLRKNLGFHDSNRQVKDRRAAGVASLMLDVRKTWQDALTQETLFSWHALLLDGARNIRVGAWRDHEEPMQIVSGAIGREKVHYEAPPSSQVPHEMERFISWFNNSADANKNRLRHAPVRCAIAHLYFESIHPFEDGNGRIGRAIAEKALSQGIGRPVLLSLSEAIESKKRAYYESLKQAQHSIDITDWVHYFIGVILQAQSNAEAMIDFTLRKVRFFDRFQAQLNERQQLGIRRALDEGPDILARGISAGLYAELAKTSRATATRDLQDMLEAGVVARLGESGGRSTRYRVEL
jgi:Fic family protein